jgi:ankyrin repeat protein
MMPNGCEEQKMSVASSPLRDFLEAATWHGSLERAEEILKAHPEVAAESIHAAAVLGDEQRVRAFIDFDAGAAKAVADPYGTNPLVYLCLSKYLRLDEGRSDALMRTAAMLLDAGVDPNSGFWTRGSFPEFETALYGAAGVAHHPGMTRLLLERGANPNDEEAVYHSPETRDNRAMTLLVETGRLTDDHLMLMLIRKHDWHDYEGVKYLLGTDLDLNRERFRGWRPLHHAIARDNHVAIIDLLLDHGADPSLKQDGRSAFAMAARKGRGDVLESVKRRGVQCELEGVDRLIAACASVDEPAARALAIAEPNLVKDLVAQGGRLLAEFSGVGNTDGVRLLLALGVPVAALHVDGDPYFGEARDSTALHVAAWRARHQTVKLLLEHHAPVNARDAQGRTPLMLAVKACVDSYWSDWRSPESVDALLRAGASLGGVAFPSGYQDIDDLLDAHRARQT